MKRKRFSNVWDAIEPHGRAAASMKARARMMVAIRETVEAWGGTQANRGQAARAHTAAE